MLFGLVFSRGYAKIPAVDKSRLPGTLGGQQGHLHFGTATGQGRSNQKRLLQETDDPRHPIHLAIDLAGSSRTWEQAANRRQPVGGFFVDVPDGRGSAGSPG
jgi:hypothetical protein